MSFKMDFANSTLNKNLDKMSTKLNAALLMYSTTKAKQLEAKMKMNRPWTDRTGMAKALLNTSISQRSLGTVRITLSHGVEYGIWLELANEKNYAVIEPTIKEESPKIINDLKGLMDLMRL